MMVAFLNPFFDTVFGWLLVIPPFWSILILSLLVSLIIVVITKFTTDQDLMKRLKGESKELQKQMKTLKEHPEKLMAVQKQQMEMSMKMMRQSFRPMIWTLIPILLIFGWMQDRLAYEPIMPDQEFSVKLQFEKGVGKLLINASAPEGIIVTGATSKEVSDGVAIFTFRAEEEGHYTAPGLNFNIDGKDYTKDVIVTAKRNYVAPIKQVRDGIVRSIETMHDKVKVIRIGTFSLSWLWSYIIFSIFFSSVLRKLLKVY
jgi:uncharacterized membrane protein (DUF106 family)